MASTGVAVRVRKDNLVTLQFTESFRVFVGICKATEDVDSFASELRKFRTTFPLEWPPWDTFEGWHSEKSGQTVLADMSQQFNQLAAELAKQPSSPLQVEKLEMMLTMRWAQTTARDFPSIMSLTQIAISNNNDSLLTMLFRVSSRASIVNYVKGGPGQGLLPYTAKHGSTRMFSWMLQQPKVQRSSSLFFSFDMRNCMRGVLECGVAKTGLSATHLATLDTILQQDGLDKLDPLALYKVTKTCKFKGCKAVNKNCNPLLQTLIECGAPCMHGPRPVMLCDRRAKMIYGAMKERATQHRLAFIMGSHKKVKANCLVRMLDPGLLRYIVDMTGIGSSTSPDPKYRWLPQAPPAHWN
jgi:hypothetical protein